ncbi:MAG: hypothetical protein [Arizlama microvirus]|nr:MAG: hypothetical protein [Arizlama microvirus]
MYMMTSLNDLNKAVRNPDGTYTLHVWYEQKWSLLGTKYSKKQIEAAIAEHTIERISAEKAAKYIRISQWQCEQKQSYTQGQKDTLSQNETK